MFDGSLSLSSSPIITYSWSFGDGVEASQVTVTHTYTISNLYMIILLVADQIGLTGTTTQTVQIEPQSPE